MRRSTKLVVAVVAAALATVGCSSKSSSSVVGSQTTPPPTSTAPPPAALGSASIQGVGRIVTDPQGFTLYYLTTDNAHHISCVDACAQTWPPVLMTSVPSAPSSVTDQLKLVSRADGGMQLSGWNQPLYRYVGDTAPGQANGNGIGKVWYAMPVKGPLPNVGHTGGS